MSLEDFEQIRSFDNENFVHPWESMKEFGTNSRTFAEKADGIYLYDENGQKLIDGPGGMWCVQIGYGRKEMAPFSDIDLLFLTPYKQTAWGESVIESILYILWDLKFKVGYSVRTIDDCLRLGNKDFTIRTNLLENRFLAGEESLQEKLKLSLWNKLFKNSGSQFVEAKLLERSERHEKQGKIRYTLEPNVKEGKGGLRDLQTLYWIAKYIYQTDKFSDQSKYNFLLKLFDKAEIINIKEF